MIALLFVALLVPAAALRPMESIREVGESAALGRRLLANGSDSQPDISQVLNSPSNCSGWPEPRVYLEGQAWFTRYLKYENGTAMGPEAIDAFSSQLRVGACLPHRQYISKRIVLHILVKKFRFPKGPAGEDLSETAPIDLQVQFEAIGTSRKLVTKRISTLRAKGFAWSCERGVCSAATRVAFPLTNPRGTAPLVADGLQRLWLVATLAKLPTQKGSRAMAARIGALTLVDNFGKPDWPKDQVYNVPQWSFTKFPWGNLHSVLSSELPVGHVNGTWAFNTRHHIQWAAKKYADVSSVYVSVDPRYNLKAIDDSEDPDSYKGTPVLPLTAAASDPQDCPASSDGLIDCQFKNLQIDTSTLSNGRHKLFIRTDSTLAPGNPLLGSGLPPGTFSSASLITFDVCNDETGANCTEVETQAPPDEGKPGPAPEDPKQLTGVSWYNGNQTLPEPDRPLSQPYNCSGWDLGGGSRVYLEGQGWYTRPGDDLLTKSTQIHVGACVPHKQSIANQIPLHIVLKKHYFPSNANVTVTVRVRFLWSMGKLNFDLIRIGREKDWECEDKSAICKAVYTTSIKTVPKSGEWFIDDGPVRMELWATAVIDDGKNNRTLTGRVQTWFVLANYQLPPDDLLVNRPMPPVARATTNFPWQDAAASMQDALPLDPFSGAWKFDVKHSLVCKVTGVRVTGLYVAVNPSFTSLVTPVPGYALLDVSDAESRGRPFVYDPPDRPLVYCEAASGDGGAVHCNITVRPKQVPLDCAGWNKCDGLCDGRHRMFIRTDSVVRADNPVLGGSNMNHGTFSSVLVVPFRTDNNITRDPSCPAGAEASLEAESLVTPLSDGGVFGTEAVLVPDDGAADGAATAAAEWAAAYDNAGYQPPTQE